MKRTLSRPILKCRTARSTFLLLALALAACSGRETGSTNSYDQEMVQLRDREQKLLRANDSLMTLLAQTPVQPSGGSTGGGYLLEGDALQRARIPVTSEGLGAYLQEKHPELIGAEGVLGGTMRFEEALPLAGQYVFASLSDGHIMAYALYRYEVARGGKVTWKRVYASPPDQ